MAINGINHNEITATREGSPAHAEATTPASQETPAAAPALNPPPPEAEKLIAKPAEQQPNADRFNTMGERIRLWKHLVDTFGRPQGFEISTNTALTLLLQKHSADEVIAFIDRMIETFPKAFAKDGWSRFVRAFEGPPRSCREMSGSAVRMMGKTTESYTEKPIERSERYDVCTARSVLGETIPDYEATLLNLMEIHDLGQDAVAFLSDYLGWMEQEFQLDNVSAYIAAYHLNEENPGMFRKYARMVRSLRKIVPDFEVTLNTRNAYLTFAKESDEQIDAFVDVVAWLDGFHWSDNLNLWLKNDYHLGTFFQIARAPEETRARFKGLVENLDKKWGLPHYRIENILELARGPDKRRIAFDRLLQWMEGRGWGKSFSVRVAENLCFEEHEVHERQMNVYEDVVGEALTLSKLIPLQDEMNDFLRSAERIIPLFGLSEKPSVLETVALLRKMEKDGEPLEAFAVWVRRFDSDPDYLIPKSSQCNYSVHEQWHNPKTESRERVGIAFPEPALHVKHTIRMSEPSRARGIPPLLYTDRDTRRFMMQLYEASPKAFFLLEKTVADFERHVPTKYNIRLIKAMKDRIQERLKEGKPTDALDLEHMGAIAKTIASVLLLLTEEGMDDAADASIPPERQVKQLALCGPNDIGHLARLLVDDGLLATWDEGHTRGDIARFEETSGLNWNNHLSSPLNSKHRFLAIPPDRRRRVLAGSTFGKLLHAYPELRHDPVWMLQKLAELDDERTHPLALRLAAYEKMLRTISKERLDDIRRELSANGIDWREINIDEFTSILSLFATPEKKAAFETICREGRAVLGATPILIDYERFAPLYRQLADGDERKQFWKMAGFFLWNNVALGTKEIQERIGDLLPIDIGQSGGRTTGRIADTLLPLWTKLPAEERLAFHDMTFEEGIVPEYMRPWSYSSLFTALRTVMPFERERAFLKRYRGSGIIINNLLGKTISEPNAERFAQIRRLADKPREVESLVRTFQRYKADSRLPHVHPFLFLDHYEDFIWGKGNTDVETDDMEVVVWGQRRDRGNPWIDDKDLRYTYELSDHWFLRHEWKLASHKLYPELGRLIEGGRDELEEKVRSLITAQTPQGRLLGKNHYETNQMAALEKFSSVDLAKIFMALTMMRRPQVRHQIGRMLEADVRDPRSEHGGVLRMQFEEIAPKESKGDGAYILNETKHYRNGLAGFHFHSLAKGKEMSDIAKQIRIDQMMHGVPKEKLITEEKIDNTYFSGPSGGDLEAAAGLRLDGIVITRLSDRSFNVDFYAPLQHDERRDGFIQVPVLDLGIYYHDPAQKAPIPQEDSVEVPADDAILRGGSHLISSRMQ